MGCITIKEPHELLHPDAWHRHKLICPKCVDVFKKEINGFRFKPGICKQLFTGCDNEKRISFRKYFLLNNQDYFDTKHNDISIRVTSLEQLSYAEFSGE